MHLFAVVFGLLISLEHAHSVRRSLEAQPRLTSGEAVEFTRQPSPQHLLQTPRGEYRTNVFHSHLHLKP